MTAVRPALALAAVIAAATAAAPVAAGPTLSVRPAAEAPVELLRPAPGELLEAGREATIAWRPVRDLAAAGIHEWEAFLSFDGGGLWPVRITPHLDVELASFRFVVPPVASDRVRLMLRFGDERREIGYVMPSPLRTVVPAVAWVPAPAPAWRQGERARPGAPGVVRWVEGRRDGRELEIRAVTWTPPGLGAVRPPALAQLQWLAPPERRGPGSVDVRVDPRRSPSAERGEPAASGGSSRALPLLLLLVRRNE